MKRIFSMILVLTMILSMLACGSQTAAPAQTTAGDTAVPTADIHTASGCTMS